MKSVILLGQLTLISSVFFLIGEKPLLAFSFSSGISSSELNSIALQNSILNTQYALSLMDALDVPLGAISDISYTGSFNDSGWNYQGSGTISGQTINLSYYSTSTDGLTYNFVGNSFVGSNAKQFSDSGTIQFDPSGASYTFNSIGVDPWEVSVGVGINFGGDKPTTWNVTGGGSYNDNSGRYGGTGGYNSNGDYNFSGSAEITRKNTSIGVLAAASGNTNKDTGKVTVSVTAKSVPEPLTMLGAATAVGFGTAFKRRLAKVTKESKNS